MADVLETLGAMRREHVARADDNRKRFPFAAEMLDAFKAGGITATVVYAENAQGETIGKRDAGPWCEYRRDGVAA